jgi:hypothetical protein
MRACDDDGLSRLGFPRRVQQRQQDCHHSFSSSYLHFVFLSLLMTIPKLLSVSRLSHAFNPLVQRPAVEANAASRKLDDGYPAAAHKVVDGPSREIEQSSCLLDGQQRVFFPELLCALRLRRARHARPAISSEFLLHTAHARLY